jgi:integrase
MASAERLPSKRWRGLYRDAGGRKCRVPGTFGRKSDAVEAAQEAEVEARRKAAASTGKLSARTKWGDWYTIFSADRRFDSDHGENLARLVKSFVLPRWGQTPLNAITRQDAQAWVDTLQREGRSANYIRSIFSTFAVSVNGAVDKGILSASPVAGVKLPRAPKRAKPFVSVDESAKLGEKLNGRYRDAVEFLLECGLRPGELAGLHAARLDLDGGWMTVAEVHVRRKNVIRGCPKDRDARQVPLTPKAVEIVQRQLGGRDLNQGCGIDHTDGSRCRSPLVFLNNLGGALNSVLLGRHLRSAAVAVGLPSKGGYAMRRGFATRAAEGGMDAFTLADVMGHADVKQTREYVQQTQSARARMLAALGERPKLAAVEDVGPRGTDRGTDSDNQALPTVTNEDETDTA